MNDTAKPRRKHRRKVGRPRKWRMTERGAEGPTRFATGSMGCAREAGSSQETFCARSSSNGSLLLGVRRRVDERSGRPDRHGHAEWNGADIYEPAEHRFRADPGHLSVRDVSIGARAAGILPGAVPLPPSTPPRTSGCLGHGLGVGRLLNCGLYLHYAQGASQSRRETPLQIEVASESPRSGRTSTIAGARLAGDPC